MRDIHSVLEVTVYDEDRDKKVEFLGRLSIPLLKVSPGRGRYFLPRGLRLVLFHLKNVLTWARIC